MTRAQRRDHLIAWLVLSPVILGVLIAALALRAQGHSRSPQIMPNSGEGHP